MSEIIEKTLQQFLDELASKSATPGGGSAAALMGAQAAALTSMVCRLTIGKPQYQAVESQMQQLLERSEQLRAELTGMVKADVDVFNQLMAAYGMPKATELEKTERSAMIQNVLKQATEVPLTCARLCRMAITLSYEAALHGYTGVISDAGVAVLAAYSGLKSAALNVYINTGSIKDTAFTENKLAELQAILEGAEQLTEQVYQIVKEKL